VTAKPAMLRPVPQGRCGLLLSGDLPHFGTYLRKTQSNPAEIRATVWEPGRGDTVA
jgi:hypothetical protein